MASHRIKFLHWKKINVEWDKKNPVYFIPIFKLLLRMWGKYERRRNDSQSAIWDYLTIRICNKVFSIIYHSFSKHFSHFFTFFYILYKKKALESWKFSTSGFWRIYKFWGVLNKISLFLQNICLSVCETNFMWPH